MFEVVQNGTKRLDITMSGKLNSEEILVPDLEIKASDRDQRIEAET